MPLTPFQQRLLADLTSDQSAERHLAGGAAMHIAPNSLRFSKDFDFFHDSEARVAATFAGDRERLDTLGYTTSVEISQPGFIRAVVRHGADETRVDWAHVSAWRFMPLVRDVGALCWAAVGKDPGFTPLSLLELLKRRGRYRPEDFARLELVSPFDLVAAKTRWLNALSDAEEFIRGRPLTEIGCLYWSAERAIFVMPRPTNDGGAPAQPHWGVPGGVLPQLSGVSGTMQSRTS